MKIIVVVPTYNERRNLKPLFFAVLRALPECHVLVIDDSSPDGTGKLADLLHSNFPNRMSVIHRAAKKGLGTAYIEAFNHVLQQDYDVVIQMDADLSHSPRYLPQLVAALEKSDVVVGSRYLQGVNVVKWDFKRLLLSKLATQLTRLITRMPFTDVTSGYRGWRCKALSRIDRSSLFASGYLFQIELLFMAHLNGLSITEIPIIFYERKHGKSKMSLSIILEAVVGLIWLKIKAVWQQFI